MLWALVTVPLAAGVGLLVWGRRADRAAAAVALVAAVLSSALAIACAVVRPSASVSYLEGISFGLRVDGLSSVMVVTVTVVALAVLVSGAGEFGAGQARPRFFGLLLVFVAAMLVTVTATTLLSLLMAWEVMGAMSYALIGLHWRRDRNVESGNIAFLTTRAADLGLYLAAGAALAGGVDGLALAGLASLPGGWRDAVAAGVVLAALGKSAQLPFSFWLSRAMDGPSPVSALLHSATMVAAGAYLLLRMQPLLAATGWAASVVTWVGMVTALALGAVALAQPDLKQLLAASTCAQLGFMVVAAGAGGIAAGSAHLVTHAVTKSLLFLAAGAWLTALGTRDLGRLRGAARRYPLVGGSFVVGAACLAGLAPLSMWATKDQVLAVALHESTPLYLLGLAASALSAGYAARAAVLVLTPPPQARPGPPVAAAQRYPLPPLAAGAALLGVLAVHGVWTAYADVVAGAALPTPVWWEYLLSAGIALVAAAAAAGVVRRLGDVPSQRRLADWFGLERLAYLGVAAPALSGTRALARFDDRVVDGGVRAVGTFGTALARLTDNRLEWSLDSAVSTVTRLFRTLGRLARRPQTGQLHQYYAQAFVALAALAALLILITAVR